MRNDGNGPTGYGGCPRAAEGIACLLGELAPPERADYEAHIAVCRRCAEELAQNRAAVARLRSDPDAECSPGLTARIAANVFDGRSAQTFRPTQGRFCVPVWARRAAGILLALGVGVLVTSRLLLPVRPSIETPDLMRPERAAAPTASHDLTRDEALRDAHAWLRQVQAEEGGWKAGRGEELADYSLGVSGLALLALMEGQEKGEMAGENAAAIRKGVEFLVSEQSPEGLFGPDFAGAPYNQGLATLALLEACVLESNATWRAAAERALGLLVAEQDSRGGWNYRHSAPGDINTSISVWPLICLSHAHATGLADLTAPIQRGLAWLRGAIDPDGLMGYHRAGESPHGHGTLTAAGAVCLMKGNRRDDLPVARRMLPIIRKMAEDPTQPMDFYRDFFVAQALCLASDSASGATMAALGTKTLALQVRTGSAAGAWPASDRWSSVGGPVYATALAAMTLPPNQ